MRVLSLLENVVMKIHEKILTHYLSCTSPIDKEGYLYKKKERTSSYQRRWFVLKANLLFYQERPADRHLLGVIVLEGCAVQRCESEGGLFAFSMVFRGSGLKTYRLAAEDQLGQESWVKVLLTASHCYLSLLVRDLGKQYEGPVRREGGSHSASNVLQVPPIPSKVMNKRSPKHWPKRNAHVTPINGPAPPYGEWPQVDFDPLEDFTKLHDYYGEEVMQLRADWLRRRQEEQEHIEEDLIDLSEH
ncbi:sesquipedalian-1-like isoform X3 [Salmo trutta]|uniref:sesquipedalian-1-like isoform X3 n=1 Tax=Salmo trutta TaxID=8032 RepID=UPI001131A35A|nr:sesquipedalian-1-like isoform X3 [Salmo trutta]